jgi:hypothetical protein
MPGAPNQFTAAAELIAAGFTRFDLAYEASLTQGCTIVGAAISDRKILASDIEDADFPATHCHQHPLTRRNLVNGRHDVPGHSSNL